MYGEGAGALREKILSIAVWIREAELRMTQFGGLKESADMLPVDSQLSGMLANMLTVDSQLFRMRPRVGKQELH